MERRYVIFKLEDLEALSWSEQEELNVMIQKMEDFRVSSGKEPLEGLFIDKTWPIFPSISEQINLFIEAANDPKSSC